MPELIFVAGCNAAGKSTFIRTRLNELESFEILMTDVYKSRTKDLAKQAIDSGKDVLIETVFNDASFRDIADYAKNVGYQTSLVVLFLDSLEQSITRVALRGMQQSGITISGSNIKINFYESFKNITNFFFYFDRSDFVYTGEGEVNQLIMSFHNGELINYHSSNLTYPQNFVKYGISNGRIDADTYGIVTANKGFTREQRDKERPPGKFNLQG